MADAVRLGLDPGSAGVLRGYQRRRRFDSTTLMASTDGLVRLFSNDVAPLRTIRGLGLGAVERIPSFKRMAIRHALGTLGTLPRLLRAAPLTPSPCALPPPAPPLRRSACPRLCPHARS